MSQRYWFKAKTYGYGWYPATWEGWLVLIGFLALTAWSVFSAQADNLTGKDLAMRVVPITIFNLAILLTICVLTGEKARWRWGKK